MSLSGCAGPPLLCGLSLVVASRALFSCGAWALEAASLIVERGLQGTRASVVTARGPQGSGSVVVVSAISCSEANGIFPDQGLNLCPLHWQVVVNPWPTAILVKIPHCNFNRKL